MMLKYEKVSALIKKINETLVEYDDHNAQVVGVANTRAFWYAFIQFEIEVEEDD